MSLQPFSAAVFAPGHGPLGRIAGAISHDEQRVRAVPSFGLVPVTLESFPNLARFACSHRYCLLAPQAPTMFDCSKMPAASAWPGP